MIYGLPGFLIGLIFLLFLSLVIVPGITYCFFFRKGKGKNNSHSPAYPIDLTQGSGQTLASLWRVNKAILSALDFEKLTDEVVNVVLRELNYLKIGYRIAVLTLVDQKAGIMRRVSFSPTPEAVEMLKKARVKFHELRIPLSAKNNLLVRAVEDQKVYVTHDLSDVLYPEKTREVWREVQRLGRIKTSLVFPLVIRGESIGAMIFSLSKSEKEISDYEKGVLGGFTDAVAVALENASLYRRLKQANAKLKELDERKDEFVSVAAHELRAPMTAIKGYLSMILEGDAGKITPEVIDYLGEARDGNDRLIRLVNNMLNVSRIEEGRMVFQMGTVSLAKAVITVFHEFEAEAKQRGLAYSLGVSQVIDDTVYVDQDRIHEVMANFMSNAIKYTDQGSVTVKLFNKESMVRFEVKDTGPGISQADLGKLFQKFSRVESSAGKKIGTGLGLYIAKLLIEEFGGKIGVESKMGKGSTFWFELPLETGKVI